MFNFSISQSAQSIDNEWIMAIGLLLNNSYVFGALIIFLGLFFERQKDRRIRLAAALIFTFIIVSLTKNILAVDRPCIDVDVDFCPSSFSLPSMHAAISFTLAFAFIDRKNFPAFFVFALFVAFTRLNIGVHNFVDIAAALPLAFMSVFLVRKYWRFKK
jgi:membrane-associated phospholipid phosphatase